MAEATITIKGTDLASDVFAKVASALKDTGGAASEASGHTDTFAGSLANLGSSFVARVAEGVLLRDAIHELINVAKDGILAFPELVEHTIHVGNSMYEMSLKTGASVENLSALRYVASQTGIDFDGFGTTLFKMEQALGSSGAKADQMQEHLDTLGLSLQTLKNEKPDQAFIDIMSALEEMPNRADQATVGMAIFGRGFKDMAGLTQESIGDLMQEAKDLGLVMSTETASAAHAVEIGFKGFSMQLEAVGMEVGATVLPALLALTKLVSGEFHSAVEAAGHPIVDLTATVKDAVMTMLDWASVGIDTAQFLDNAFLGTKAMLFDVEAKIVDVASAFIGWATTAAEVANQIPGMRGDFDGLVGTLKDSKTWVDGFAEGLHNESDAALDAAGKHGVMFDGLKAGIGDMKDHFGDEFDKAGDEIAHFAEVSHHAVGGVGTDVVGAKDKVDKFADAWKNLNSIGDSFEDTVRQINPQLVAEIGYYVTAGAKVSDLAEAYKNQLTPAQVDAIDKMVKANDKYSKSWQDTQDAIDKIWDTALATEDENNKKGLDLQLAKLAKSEQNEKDSAAKKNRQGTGDETQLQDAMDAITAKYEAARHVATTNDAKKVTDETNSIWNDFYALQDAHSGTATDKEIADVKRWYDDKVTKAAEAGIVDQGYYDALDALAQEKMHQVYLSHDQFAQDTKKLLGDLTTGPGGWIDTFDNILVHTGSFKDAATGVWDLLKKDTLGVFSSLLNDIIHGFLDELLSQVAAYVEKMIIKFAVLKTLEHIFSFGIFSEGGVAGSSDAPSVTKGYGSTGGSVTHSGIVYAADGWPNAPRGTDTVPAMLTPGERVLNVRDTQAFDNAGGMSAIRGGGGGDIAAQVAALHVTMQQFASEMKRGFLRMPRMMSEAQQLSGRA